MAQQMFNPCDFHFEWTSDWYDWDLFEGHREARRVRDIVARRLRREGHKVRSFRLPNQVITRGGVGTNRSQIEFVVTVYGLSY